jgi:hypothetical protein
MCTNSINDCTGNSTFTLLHTKCTVISGGTHFSGGFNGCPILEEKLNNLDSVLLACNVEWCEAI